MLNSSEIDWLKSEVRNVPDFPKKGIDFKDITTLLENPEANQLVFSAFKEYAEKLKIDRIIGIDSRGFIFGNALALALNIPFTLVRKKGKLPSKTIHQAYALEYGEAIIEVHEDSVKKGERVLIHDDLLATGGTAEAAAKLVQKSGGEVVGFQFIIELEFLKGINNLKKYSENIQSLIAYS